MNFENIKLIHLKHIPTGNNYIPKIHIIGEHPRGYLDVEKIATGTNLKYRQLYHFHLIHADPNNLLELGMKDPL